METEKVDESNIFLGSGIIHDDWMVVGMMVTVKERDCQTYLFYVVSEQADRVGVIF